MHVNKGDIIFLENDKNDGAVYFLTRGKMLKSHPSLSSSENKKSVIREGNLFGLTSALSASRRDSTTQALESSHLVKMSIDELKALLEKNIKLLLKLLVNYSNEMLTVHKEIENHLNLGSSLIENSERLYQSGLYYLENEKTVIARYIFERFSKLYPDKHQEDVQEILKKLEKGEDFSKEEKTGEANG